jgi:hypothetical protein
MDSHVWRIDVAAGGRSRRFVVEDGRSFGDLMTELRNRIRESCSTHEDAGCWEITIVGHAPGGECDHE